MKASERFGDILKNHLVCSTYTFVLILRNSVVETVKTTERVKLCVKI